MQPFLNVWLIALSMVMASGCKPRHDESSLAGSVVLDADLPAIAYHYGPYKPLRDGADDLQAFMASYDNAIYYEDSVNNPYRLGFYVSRHPAYNERYGRTRITRPRDQAPWIARISIDPACRKAERVFSKNNLAPLLGKAAAAGARAPKGCEETTGFGPPFKASGKQNACADWLVQYGRRVEKDQLRSVTILEDLVWPGLGFWYLNDRKCITRIEASPQDVVRLMAEVTDYWMQAPFTDNRDREERSQVQGRPGDSTYYLLVRALAETADFPLAAMKYLQSTTKKSDIPWLKAAASRTIDQAIACFDAGWYDSFRSQADSFIDLAAKPGYLSYLNSKGTVTYEEHIDGFLKLIERNPKCKKTEVDAAIEEAPSGVGFDELWGKTFRSDATVVTFAKGRIVLDMTSKGSAFYFIEGQTQSGVTPIVTYPDTKTIRFEVKGIDTSWLFSPTADPDQIEVRSERAGALSEPIIYRRIQ